jgi:hypothetical protein
MGINYHCILLSFALHFLKGKFRVTFTDQPSKCAFKHTIYIYIYLDLIQSLIEHKHENDYVCLKEPFQTMF